MKYLIFTSRWLSILVCLFVAFIILMLTIAVVFFKQQEGVQISDASLASVSYLPFFMMVAFFAIISILFAEDLEFGGEFLSLLSAGIAHLFLFYTIIHALGHDVLAIIAQHNFKGMDGSVPVFEGLATACPWWLLIASIIILSTLEACHDRLEKFATTGFFLYGPYLILKVIQLF